MKRLSPIFGMGTELGMRMGLTVAGLIGLDLLIGRWLDAKLGTEPFATMLLMVAGAVTGLFSIYRLATRVGEQLSGDTSRPLNIRDAFKGLSVILRALGFVVLPGVLGVLVGLWLDHLAGTGVIITFILVLGGFGAGIVGCLRLFNAMPSGSDKEGDDECPDPEN